MYFIMLSSQPASAEGMQFHCGAFEGISYIDGYGRTENGWLGRSGSGWENYTIPGDETIIRFSEKSAEIKTKYTEEIWEDYRVDLGADFIWRTAFDPPGLFTVLVQYPTFPAGGGTSPSGVVTEVFTITSMDFETETAKLLLTTSKSSMQGAVSRVVAADCEISPF